MNSEAEPKVNRHDRQPLMPCALLAPENLRELPLVGGFQPIVAIADQTIVAHLARLAGPPDCALRSPDAVFCWAIRLGVGTKFAKAYFNQALQPLREFAPNVRLVLPLPGPMASQWSKKLASALDKVLSRQPISAARLTVQLPEFDRCQDRPGEQLRDLGMALRANGCGIALPLGYLMTESDGFWENLGPDLVTLDPLQFAGLDPDRVSLDHLRKLLQSIRTRGCLSLATGIHSASALAVAAQTGVDWATGHFVGQIKEQPTGFLATRAERLLRATVAPVASAEQQFTNHLLGRLLQPIAPVAPATTAEEVYRIFEHDPELRAIAVVEAHIPLGLISRFELVDNMARPFHHELFGRRSCTAFMDSAPLSADVRISLPDLADLVSSGSSRHVISGFIVTDRGRYLGMSSVQDLMRELTMMQLDAARYANPLTQLPGNVPIQKVIEERLEARLAFVVAYCDIDHFKPVNDVFGYAMGDKIIAFTGQLLSESIDPELDFVGHIGGDDFVLVFGSPDWQERVDHLLREFASRINPLFPQEIQAAGGFSAPNRRGVEEFFPLTTISIGALEVLPGGFHSHLAIASVVSEAKKKAKAIPGCSLYVNQRNYEPTPIPSRESKS